MICTKNYLLRFAKVRNVRSPERGTPGSAGIDFFIPEDFPNTALYPNRDVLIPSGIKAQIPEGYMLMGADKSGIASSREAKNRAGMDHSKGTPTSLIIGAKIVDEDYQGEIHIHIINVGQHPVILKPGMKIAQFILIPVLYAELTEVFECSLFDKDTERGSGGFGSTTITENF